MQGDLASDELDDLYEQVKVSGIELRAMVDLINVVDSFDTLGGPISRSVQEFKFDRDDLIQKDLEIVMGTRIDYDGQRYDVTQIAPRPDFPQFVCVAILHA